MKSTSVCKTAFCLLILCTIQQGFSLGENSTVDTVLEDSSSETVQESTTQHDEHEATHLGVKYLLSKRNRVSYGWEQETHRALTTLSLAGAIPPSDQQELEHKLMIKEMELRLALAMAKQHKEEFAAGQLALYINALLGICHNPRDFYGLNLVSKLQHSNEESFPYSYALQSLALCNAGVAFNKRRILKLIDIIKEDPSEHGFIDNLAMTTLALACGLKYHPMPPAERYLNRAVLKIKRSQKSDGSFGNIYSSGLALQALLLAETEEKFWNSSLAREYISSQQKEDGSFVDFMGTYFSLPLMMNQTFGSLANWSCGNTEPTREPIGDQTTPSPEYNATKISISLLVRAKEIQEYSMKMEGYQKDNLYGILMTNEESISIEFKDTAYGHMIVGVDGLNQDPKEMKYWLIYVVDKNGNETSAQTGVDGIYPEDGDRFVFELKSFK